MIPGQLVTSWAIRSPRDGHLGRSFVSRHVGKNPTLGGSIPRPAYALVPCPTTRTGGGRKASSTRSIPRSYADSNGDGVGDLRGIVDRLDHLAWLDVDGIWLNPVTVSPDADWGYDVADYTGVQPVLGTLDDVDALIAAANERDIKVILDLVPNHTSIEHPWFVESRSSRDNPKRDWYVWADPKPDGSPPNNWQSSFGGPTWTLDDTTGQYYLHNFLAEQPDLNWWNEEVRAEFDHILRFWFDRGVAGFRIDVVHMVVKDRDLRDNPPATDDDHWMVQLTGQRQVYNGNRPEVHDVIRRWRQIADSYDPPRILVGETHVFDTDAMVSFYGRGDELNLAFNFLLLHSRFEADALRKVVEDTMAAIPADSWPVWTGGNHDMYRFPSRWAEGDPAKTRCALMMLLTLPGSVFLYYGDELGMPDTEVPKGAPRGPGGEAALPGVRARSGAHADAVGAATGRGVHRAERGAMAALRRRRRVQRRGPTSAIPARCSRCAVTSSRCAPPSPSCAPVGTRATPPTAGCGHGAGASGSWWR